MIKKGYEPHNQKTPSVELPLSEAVYLQKLPNYTVYNSRVPIYQGLQQDDS